MIREEAITNYIVPAIKRTWNDKKCKEILEALEQEPCEDCISRQAVLDLISNFILEIPSESGRDLNAHTNDVLRQILRNVKSDRVLQSVNPQEPNIVALGEDMRICRESITDEKVLIGFNMAVALCNKHLGERSDKE